jgi:hypothetical protein
MRRGGSSVGLSHVVMIGFLLNVAASSQEIWPTIQPFSAKRTLYPGRGDTPFVAPLKTTNGTPAYEIECHSGDYENTGGFNFSGIFQCVLFAVSRNSVRTSWNLLATDQKAEQGTDWFNRARMTSVQLWGECSADPEYGTLRRFRLRNMAISFEFGDLQWSPTGIPVEHRLNRFTFKLTVVPDKTATTATAERIRTTQRSSCW